MRWALAFALALSLDAPVAQAGLFDGLFAFSESVPLVGIDEPGPAQQSDAGACIAAIRKAEAAHGIPTDLLLAIGLQEAGISYKGSTTVWPWSLNLDGQGFRFDSRAEAEAFLARAQEEGVRSIDVGCLQVNLRWHPGAFPSPAAGFDPARNADYAARFLRGLYLETGDWLEAAGRYHSATPELKDQYIAGVDRHLSRLDGAAASLDALVTPGPWAGAALSAGVALDHPAARRMNPLREPVRGGALDMTNGSPFRRSLIVLPRPAPDAAIDDDMLP